MRRIPRASQALAICSRALHSGACKVDNAVARRGYSRLMTSSFSLAERICFVPALSVHLSVGECVLGVM